MNASEVVSADIEQSEIDEQIAESKEHAEQFGMMLTKAAKRFAALANVEERHANHYKKALEKAKVEAADIQKMMVKDGIKEVNLFGGKFVSTNPEKARSVF